MRDVGVWHDTCFATTDLINNKNETDYGKYFLKDCCR